MTDRSLSGIADLDALAFDGRGLVPVVAQDVGDGRVLMVAWADREALRLSLETGEMHFRSRSRGELWRKGETSGNVLRVHSLHADCDGDTVLARVVPTGPACHTGDGTCFGGGTAAAAPAPGAEDTLAELWKVIDARAAEMPDGSYTARLLNDENLRIKKLGEEAAELVAALAKGDGGGAAEEAADLLYHVLVALRGADVGLSAVVALLRERRG